MTTTTTTMMMSTMALSATTARSRRSSFARRTSTSSTTSTNRSVAEDDEVTNNHNSSSISSSSSSCSCDKEKEEELVEAELSSISIHHHLGSLSPCYDPDCQDAKTLVDTVAEPVVEEDVAEEPLPVLAECVASTTVEEVSADLSSSSSLLVEEQPSSSEDEEEIPEVVATPIHHCDCEKNVSWKRPEFLSATVVRECTHKKFGVTFQLQRNQEGEDEDQLVIAQIDGNDSDDYDSNSRSFLKKKKCKDSCGLLANSPFCVGDILVSVNKTSCAGMQVAELGALLRNLTGTITFVVQNKGGDATLVESFLAKPTPDSKTGIGLKYSPRYNRLRIKHVHYSGLLVESLLQVDGRVVAINQIPCRNWDAQTAAQHIADSPRHVSIVTKAHRDAGAVLTVQDPEEAASSKKNRRRSRQRRKSRRKSRLSKLLLRRSYLQRTPPSNNINNNAMVMYSC